MTRGNVCIIDYGMGNLRSVASAFATLGCDPQISSESRDLTEAGALVLPGVGAFGEAMDRLRDLNLIDVLERQVLDAKVPFLGICLGMQLLGKQSTEGGVHDGLGWIDVAIDKIPADTAIRVPHIGWNEVTWKGDGPLNINVEQGSHFFFNHSFYMTAEDEHSVATVDVGVPLIAAVVKENIWGVQFHPEKSQNNGRRLLRNFLNVVQTAAER